MGAVYSILIESGGIPGGYAAPIATVPAGKTWIIRDVIVVNGGTSGEIFSLTDETGSMTWLVVLGQTPLTMFHWAGRQVFPQGFVIGTTNTGGAWDLRVSGYSLTN